MSTPVQADSQFQMFIRTFRQAFGIQRPEDVQTEQREILAESIRIALEHNLDIKIEQFAPEIARYNLNLAYAGWEPVFDFSGTHSYSQQPGGIDAQNRPFAGTTTERDTFSTGLAGVLPTGLSYDLSGDISNTTGENAFGPFENASGSTSIRLRQPLLKNFWIDSTRLNIKVSKQRLKVSDVCRGTGIARATLDRYYSDKVSSFDREVLSKLCDFLQVKPGDLLVLVDQGDLFAVRTDLSERASP